MNTSFVIPTNIPWQHLTGKELEEALFWLLDSIGGKDLQWRIGGRGAGAPDNGRDLEANFYVVEPDSELRCQKWWIESKGRTHTVEPAAVHEAVLNAGGFQEVDVVVVATNSLFSNPTRDWVNQWQRTNPRPAIRLWDRNSLEKLFSQHPEVVARLFPEALSLEGRMQFIRSRFWNYGDYVGEKLLENLWRNFEEVNWEADTFLAVLVSEFANGDINNSRSWAARLLPGNVQQILSYGVANSFAFTSTLDKMGSSHTYFVQALSYLLLIALNTSSLADVKQVLQQALVDRKLDKLPAEAFTTLLGLFIDPFVGELKNEVFEACASDCRRIFFEPVSSRRTAYKEYWRRLNFTDEEIEVKGENLIIEQYNKPCNIGLPLNAENTCPIFRVCTKESDTDSTLQVIQEIIVGRANLTP